VKHNDKPDPKFVLRLSVSKQRIVTKIINPSVG